jgi:hypothetical protein
MRDEAVLIYVVLLMFVEGHVIGLWLVLIDVLLTVVWFFFVRLFDIVFKRQLVRACFVIE